MFSPARILGLVAALAMFVFSAYMFAITRDWVAVIFAVGSFSYFVFFFSYYKKGNKP